MRPVEMNRTGMLAAAMYAILEDRESKELVEGFSVSTELTPGYDNDKLLFGSIISGHISLKGGGRREFVIDFTYVEDRGIMVEVPYRIEYYSVDNPIAHINTKIPAEIDFAKRSITYKRVETFSMKNVSWGWREVKGTAADIIGMILGEENS